MSQSPVNIVYPIDGGTYPIIDADCKVKSAYFTASFGVTCAGGPRTVKWGVDGTSLDSAKFYDQFSAQFTWKPGAKVVSITPPGRQTKSFTVQVGDNPTQKDFTIDW